MKLNKLIIVTLTIFLLFHSCYGRALNAAYNVNVKCTIGVVAAGTSVGGSAGLSIGALMGSFLFPGLGLNGGLVIGLILGSSIGSGGAGIISQKICDESADLH